MARNNRMQITDYADIISDISHNSFYKADIHTLEMVADSIVRYMEAEESDFDRDGFLGLCGLDPKPDERKHEE